MRKEKCEIPGPPLRKAKVGSMVNLVCCGPGARRAEETVRVRQVEGSDIYIEGVDFAFCRRTGFARVTLQPGMLVMLDEEIISI
ncbi:hypothetical protein bAD24_III11890 [Burkholderia sp. AD24]|nr:hypothetical protein bAD24_III11890 [Burkholderia sp. AD24]